MSPSANPHTPPPPGSAEAIGQQLRDAFSGVRLHSVSLHDQQGETLWLSEGALGPDEHALVLDAMDALALEGKRQCFEKSLGDGRTAIVFPARDPRGERRGAAMLIAEARTMDGSAQEKSLTPAVQSALRRLSILLSPLAAGTSSTANRPMTMSPTAPIVAPPSPPRATSQVAPAAETPVQAGASPDGSQPVPEAFADLVLYVQQLLKLRTSGRTRRYEVLLRSRTGGDVATSAPAELLRQADEQASHGAVDRYVISQLVQWLTRNRAALDADPASFSVNLSAGALANAGFPEFIRSSLKDAQLFPKLLAFEIRESVCREHRQHVERFIGACERIGCQVVIDDFTMNSEVLPLLRSKAVRLVKIDAQLTASAMKDKLSQALVVAISQAAKVLGTHCVAKRIDSSMARQWLAAIGVDFAQGFLLEGPLPLTTLTAMRTESAVASAAAEAQ